MGRIALVLVAVTLAAGVAWLATGEGDGWWPGPAVAPDRVVVIPAGAADSKRRGSPIWTVPTRLDIRAGQSVVVRNEDDESHPILGVALAPGQAVRRAFPTPGRYYFNPAEVAGVECDLDDPSDVMAVVVGRPR